MNLRLSDLSSLEKTRSKGWVVWLPWGIFGLVALVWTAGGFWFYSQQAQIIRGNQLSELKFIADAKVSQIVQWRQERLGDIDVAAHDLGDWVVRWLQAPHDATLKAAVLARLQLVRDEYAYQNAILVDLEGTLRLSLLPDLTVLEPETRRLAAHVATFGVPVLGDFFRSSATGQIYLDLVAPLRGSDGRIGAVLILRIDPERYLYPLLQSWPAPNRTAETLLVRQDGSDVLFLNTLRYSSAPPLTLRIPLSREDVPAVQAVLGRFGEGEGVDYRGVNVLAQRLPLPNTPWFMVAKIDTAEALTEVRTLGLFVFMLVVLAVLMTAALVAYVFNDRQRRLFQNLFHAERELREAQEEIRATLYSIGDGVITVNAEGCVTRLNPVAEELTGWKEAEARGQPLERVFQIVQERTRDVVENPAVQVLREGRTVGLVQPVLLIARNGTERPIADSGAPIRAEQGQVMGVVLVFRDQSAERAAQRERALLADTLSASMNEIYIFDAHTLHFRYVNEGALSNLGYSLAQMQQMTPLDLEPEFTVEKFALLLQPLFEHQKPLQVFETVHRRADASLYPVEIHVQLFEREGEPVFLAIINDISERRRAEQEIRSLNAGLERRVADRTAQLEAANQEMEAFAYSVSHDLRAPLRAMDGFSEILLADYSGQLDEDARHYLGRIQDAARRMGQLINDLLGLSRVTRTEFARQEVDLSALVREIAADLQLRNPHKAVNFMITENLCGEGDPHLLRIALENLLNNAFKFSSQQELPQIQFGMVARQGAPAYFVRDNGVGFDMAYAGKLFLPFQRLHGAKEYPGTGIGLVTVQRIIRRHGGQIWPEAEVGRGATFYFTLGGDV